jgi:AhpD family alkylhydroperoxidase
MTEMTVTNRRADSSANEDLTKLARHGADTFGYKANLRIDRKLAQLMRLRVSQINNCTYCLNLHYEAARDAGIPRPVIDTLTAWWETGFHDDAARAALAYTEAITRVADATVADDFGVRHDALSEHFSQEEILEIIGIVINMNVWTRLKLAEGASPGPAEQAMSWTRSPAKPRCTRERPTRRAAVRRRARRAKGPPGRLRPLLVPHGPAAQHRRRPRITPPDADEAEIFYPDFYTDGPDAGAWVDPPVAWGEAPVLRPDGSHHDRGTVPWTQHSPLTRLRPRQNVFIDVPPPGGARAFPPRSAPAAEPVRRSAWQRARTPSAVGSPGGPPPRSRPRR